MTTRQLLILLACASLAARVAAQAVASAPPASRQATAAAVQLPSPPADFSYTPEGRRDPFLNLSRRGTTAAVPASGSRPSGAAGLSVEELSVRGVVESQGTFVAMVSGPSGQSFTIRAGTRLFDGTVKAITPRAVLITQQVTDPLSVEKQREVLKPLRAQEEGK